MQTETTPALKVAVEKEEMISHEKSLKKREVKAESKKAMPKPEKQPPAPLPKQSEKSKSLFAKSQPEKPPQEE